MRQRIGLPSGPAGQGEALPGLPPGTPPGAQSGALLDILMGALGDSILDLSLIHISEPTRPY